MGGVVVSYTCGECQGVFEEGVTDEEALEEEKTIFGFNCPKEERVVICDDCWNEFIARRAERLGQTA